LPFEISFLKCLNFGPGGLEQIQLVKHATENGYNYPIYICAQMKNSTKFALVEPLLLSGRVMRK
jgi:hypothetical protein